MTIPFCIKLLTPTAKLPHRNCESDLWDLYADDFCVKHIKEYTPINLGLDNHFQGDYKEYHYEPWHRDLCNILPKYNKYMGVKQESQSLNTLQIRSFRKEKIDVEIAKDGSQVTIWNGVRILIKIGVAIELPKRYNSDDSNSWYFENDHITKDRPSIKEYAVADIRPRSGLALKHGITVLNSPGTIDNSYRKEIGVILYNAGNEPYVIKKGDKIAQMLIRSLYPSKMEVVEDFKDTGRDGFGSTGK